MQLFRKPTFLAVTFGHFTIDVFNSSTGVLVAYLSVPMELTAFQVGLAGGLYQFFAAVGQPLFGWLDDRVGSRWLGPGSVAWTIGFVVTALLVAQVTNNFMLFLIPFTLASVGSSAFHPLGTKHAAEAATERAATGTSLFFLFGQTGLATGPVLTGLILSFVGVRGILGLAVVAAPVILVMVFSLRQTTPKLAEIVSLRVSDPKLIRQAVRWGAVTLLAVLLALRSWSTIGTATFLPKLFQEMGWSAASYGSITSTFWLASALAGVAAGSLADRFGRRQVVFVTLLFGSVPLYFLPLNDGWFAFLLAIATGALLGASHSILMVIGQNLLPGGKSFASGVALGYIFGTGAVAALLMGYWAETWGLAAVVQLGALWSVLAALLAFLLPATKKTPASSIVVSVPAASE
jgi:FSR family fosmidomycin resistance protein-like MFS transporter